MQKMDMPLKSVLFQTWNFLVDVLAYFNFFLFFLALGIHLDKSAFLSLTLSMLYIFWWILKDNNFILFK